MCLRRYEWRGAFCLSLWLAACADASTGIEAEPVTQENVDESSSQPVADSTASPEEPSPAIMPSANDQPEPTCPPGTVLVEGSYCPNVEQRCAEYARDSRGRKMPSICARYANPSRCLSRRRIHLRYCIDTHEYPNQDGEKPMTQVDYWEASRLCKQQGKRLCTDREFNFACEGEEMLPYATGYVRDASKCNIDKPYKRPRRNVKPYHECLRDPTCLREMNRLDQRGRVGESPACVSVFGVYDLNGNANEWVKINLEGFSRRSALKGGWWGPVRNRCRAIVVSHDALYAGYEVGFRCCSSGGGSAPRP